MVVYGQGGGSHCLYGSVTSVRVQQPTEEACSAAHLANCSRHIGRNNVKDTITKTSLRPHEVETSAHRQLQLNEYVLRVPRECVAQPASEVSPVFPFIIFRDVVDVFGEQHNAVGHVHSGGLTQVVVIRGRTFSGCPSHSLTNISRCMAEIRTAVRVLSVSAETV